MSEIPNRYKPLYDGLKVTREEYLDLEDDGYIYDMINGILHWTASETYDHQRVLVQLSGVMFDFLKKASSGKSH